MALRAATLERSLNKLAGEAGLVPGGWSKTVWTRRVKEALVELGLKESYKSCASEVSNATWVEWLYDVVWLDKNEIGLIGAIPLVGEIEWGNERAVWDGFQKLLAARAEDRVMIFEEKGPELRSWLGRQIEGFVSSREGDRYLFASYVTVERW